MRSEATIGETSSRTSAAPSDPTSPGRGLSSSPLACISFDVEPFDIPLEYGHRVPVEKQYEIGSAGLVRVLDLLDQERARATFFITGQFAERFPQLVRRIAASPLGHEIASHGYTHGDLEPGHLELSRNTLAEISGREIAGFRRARMAHTDAHDLAAAGYRYNASENPIWLPGRYNHFFDPRTARVERTQAGTLVQIPASATPLLRVPLFWLAFKNLPMPLFRTATRRVLNADGSMNTYFHPWEFMAIDSYGLPGVVKRIQGAALLERLRGYLRWLAGRSEFGTYEQLAARTLAKGGD
jgi:peptidoglycan/xylan/chitin deacetylase (PgdA/CDA1 family)